MEYQDFFNQISQIVEEYKEKKRETFVSGNSFNLFDVLNLSYVELIHSALIAELLNCHGSHGKNDVFLQLFLKRLSGKTKLNPLYAKVDVEYYIGTITKDKKRGGRIDILITDRRNNAIIIENKILANDQDNQLQRYNNFGKDRGYNYHIIYLTLDGKEASSKSTGGKEIPYLRLSYRNDILGWLEDCLAECNEGTLIHSSIKQYIDTLRNIFDMIDKENEAKLVELASAPVNACAFINLLKNRRQISKAIISRFVRQLRVAAEELGFTVEIDEGFAERANTFIAFSMPAISQRWKLWIGSDKSYASDTYYLIAPVEDHKSKIKKEDYKKIPLLWDELGAAKERPCGGAYLWSITGKKGSGEWYDWYSPQALAAMEDDSMLHFIMENILCPVIANNVINVLRTK